MKISATEIRVGNVLSFENKLWVVLKTQHTQPGKGGAFMQVEMKGLLEPTKINERFRSADTVEKVSLEDVPHTFLYKEGDAFVFMDPETYDQIILNKDLVGPDQAAYLKDGMQIVICQYEGSPISLKLPDTVVLEVSEADAVIKGQTASSSYKPALLENGLKIMVPPHVGVGMKVVVRTEDGEYIERAKDCSF
jgi:elongation factor P